MTIDDFARALERARDRAYPGRETCERDHVQRELRRLLDAHEREPRRCAAPIRLRLVARD
jgi:hypothetical protein